MCMFVLFCDRRGAWWTRSREAFFVLPYQPQHQNYQPFTSLVGAAWRDAECIAIVVVDVDVDTDVS